MHGAGMALIYMSFAPIDSLIITHSVSSILGSIQALISCIHVLLIHPFIHVFIIHFILLFIYRVFLSWIFLCCVSEVENVTLPKLCIVVEIQLKQNKQTNQWCADASA